MVRTVYCSHEDSDECECGYCDHCGEYVVSCVHDDPVVRKQADEELARWDRRNAYRSGFEWAVEQTWASRRYRLDVMARGARSDARAARARGRRQSVAYHLGLARGYRAC